jgi:hypothetical protein
MAQYFSNYSFYALDLRCLTPLESDMMEKDVAGEVTT